MGVLKSERVLLCMHDSVENAQQMHFACDPAAAWCGRAPPQPGHHNLIVGSAPVHATLAQPAAGADSLKDLRARRAEIF